MSQWHMTTKLCPKPSQSLKCVARFVMRFCEVTNHYLALISM